MRYIVVTPLSIGAARHEAGELVEGLPEASLAWLLEQGHVRRAGDSLARDGAVEHGGVGVADAGDAPAAPHPQVQTARPPARRRAASQEN